MLPAGDNMSRVTDLITKVTGNLRSSPAQVAPRGRKAAPFFWPSYANGNVVWTMNNFQDYVNEGFNTNSIIYSAILYKVRAASQAHMRAYTGDPMNPELLPPSHPLSRLVARPNPYMSWRELHGLILVYLNIAGNAYLYIDRKGSVRGIPGALYALRPDRVFLLPSETGLRGYLYRPEGFVNPEGVPILKEDMIHIKFPNPMDPFEGLGYGLSPISAMAQSADVDNMVTAFLKQFFDNGGVPMGILKFDVPLRPEQITEIKDKWKEIYGGSTNWGDIGVVDSGASYEQLGLPIDKMGFETLDARDESRILGPFGVPPILVGTTFGLERSTDTNYVNARKSFWEDTMMYELGLQQDEYDYYLTGEDGSFVKYDLSRVPALQGNIKELVDSAKTLWDMGVPSDQAFSTVGLSVEETPAGKLVFFPVSSSEWVEGQAQAQAELTNAIGESTLNPKPVAPAKPSGQADPGDSNQGSADPETDDRKDLPTRHTQHVEVTPGVFMRRKRLTLVDNTEEVAKRHEIPFQQ